MDVVVLEEGQTVDPKHVRLDGALGVVENVAAQGASMKLLFRHVLAISFGVHS